MFSLLFYHASYSLNLSQTQSVNFCPFPSTVNPSIITFPLTKASLYKIHLNLLLDNMLILLFYSLSEVFTQELINPVGILFVHKKISENCWVRILY